MATSRPITSVRGELTDATKIYDLADELVEAYQRNLQQAGVNASGELSEAARMYIYRWKGETLQLIFRLPKHWGAVEYGRSPSKGLDVWQDPVGDIMRWMKVKHIVPYPRSRDGVRPTEREVAELIVRKIHRRGFYTYGPLDKGPHGKHLLQKSIDETNIRKKLVGALVDEFNRVIKTEIADDLKEFVSPRIE